MGHQADRNTNKKSNTQMKKTILTTIGVILLSLSTQAQNSWYGAVEDFFMANPDLPNASQYASRAVNPNYLLIDWDQWNDMDQRMISNNCVRLGISSWIDNNPYGGGIPQKGLAIAYARAIGAQFVIYASRPALNRLNSAEHLVSFYSRQAGYANSVANPSQISNADPRPNSAMWPDARILTHPEHFVNTGVVKVQPNDTLKLRSGPGTRFNAVAEIPANAGDILAFDQDQVWDGDTWWCPVEWRGIRGYVGRNHLSTAH
jgi:hypothetical protein